MQSIVRFLAWLFTILAAIVAILVFLDFFKADETNREGGVILLVVCAVPALVLQIVLRSLKQRDMVAGLCRARSQFTTAELAPLAGISLPETESVVSRLINQGRIAHKFHQRTASYVDASRIAELDVEATCPKCESVLPLPSKLGEAVVCSYCGARKLVKAG